MSKCNDKSFHFSDQQYLLIVQYKIEKRQIEKEQFLKCAYNNDIRDS